jgi:hypothetical protein
VTELEAGTASERDMNQGLRNTKLDSGLLEFGTSNTMEEIMAVTAASRCLRVGERLAASREGSHPCSYSLQSCVLTF